MFAPISAFWPAIGSCLAVPFGPMAYAVHPSAGAPASSPRMLHSSLPFEAVCIIISRVGTRTSTQELQPDLHEPRVAGAADLPERGAAEIPRRVAEVGPVENVEHLPPQGQRLGLRETEQLEN